MLTGVVETRSAGFRACSNTASPVNNGKNSHVRQLVASVLLDRERRDSADAKTYSKRSQFLGEMVGGQANYPLPISMANCRLGFEIGNRNRLIKPSRLLVDGFDRLVGISWADCVQLPEGGALERLLNQNPGNLWFRGQAASPHCD
jgi:hypothetical protein